MSTRHWLVLFLLSAGYALALSYGSLAPSAAASFSLLLLAWLCVALPSHQYIRLFGHALFIVTGLALAFHLAPGFNSAQVIEATRFTADAQVFSMSLYLDKPLIGFWLILACPWIMPRVDMTHSLQTGVLALIVTSAFCMTAAVILNVVGWAPKWPDQGLIWLLNNLLLVILTEELFFAHICKAVCSACSRALGLRAHCRSPLLQACSGSLTQAPAGSGWCWRAWQVWVTASRFVLVACKRRSSVTSV